MNNNSKYSIQSRREILGINIRSNTLISELESRRRVQSQRNTLQTHQRAELHQGKVNQIATQISLLQQSAHFDANAAFDLLQQLYSLLIKDETVFIKLDTLQITLLQFRDATAGIYENQKLVPFILLCYHADHIISITTRKHIPKYKTEDIMFILAQQVEPNSREFLIQNARNSETWSDAVINQGLQLTDEKLMDIVLRMLDQPHAWKIIIAQKKIPFNQTICQLAWDRKISPEVGSFIIQQVMRGGPYFVAFYSFGIYEAFRVFIAQTIQETDKKVKIQRVWIILEGLSSLWTDPNIFGDTKQIFESRIFDWITDIPIEYFNKDALFQVLTIINRMESSPSYDLNYISTAFKWYCGLYKILLWQRVNQMIIDKAIAKIDIYCKGKLVYQASEKFQTTMKEYHAEVQRRTIRQRMV